MLHFTPSGSIHPSHGRGRTHETLSSAPLTFVSSLFASLFAPSFSALDKRFLWRQYRFRFQRWKMIRSSNFDEFAHLKIYCQRPEMEIGAALAHLLHPSSTFLLPWRAEVSEDGAQGRSPKVYLGERCLLFSSALVTAVCLGSKWAWTLEMTRTQF